MINHINALKVILVVGICGMLFSGYLSYQELFSNGCTLGCSSLPTSSLFGIPVCVFGLIMYTIIVVVSTLGLIRKNVSSEAKV